MDNISHDSTAVEPRKRGRPKGAGNRLTADMKAIILEKGRPLDLLCAIAAGNLVKASGPDGKSMKVVPTLADRLSAARVLLAKILPDMKTTEHTGDPDRPMQAEFTGLETARRLAFLLATGAGEQTQATESSCSGFGQLGGGGSGEAVGGPSAAPAPASLFPDTANPEPATPPAEPIEEVPPSVGASAWVGSYEIVNIGPQRPGLGDSYQIRQGGLIHCFPASFKAAKAWIEKRSDGSWEAQPINDRPLPTSRRGYGNRKD